MSKHTYEKEILIERLLHDKFKFENSVSGKSCYEDSCSTQCSIVYPESGECQFAECSTKTCD